MVVQAITHMVRRLRQGHDRHGLILANGGTLTYQHVVCLASKLRKDGLPYPDSKPLPDVIEDMPVPFVALQPQGEATIEVTKSILTPGRVR